MYVFSRCVAAWFLVTSLYPVCSRADAPPPDLGPLRESLPAALQRAEQAAREIPAAAFRDGALRAIGRAFLRIGDRDAARDVLRRTLAGLSDPALSADLARDLALAGDREAARELFHRAEQEAVAEDEPFIRVWLLQWISRDEAAAREDESARLSARRASEIARSIHDDTRESLLLDVLAAQHTLGDHEGLRVTLDGILRDLEQRIGRGGNGDEVSPFEEPFATDPHGEMIEAILIAGEFDEAIRRIERWGRTSTIGSDLLTQVADAVMGTSQRLLSPFGPVPGPGATPAVDRIDPDEGRFILERLRRLAVGLDNSGQATVLASIAAAEGRLGDFEAAVATIRRIGHLEGFESIRVAPMIAVARSMGAAGETAGARDLLRDAYALSVDSPDDNAVFLLRPDSGLETGLAAIARAQVEVGDLDAARKTYNALRREHDASRPPPGDRDPLLAGPDVRPYQVIQQAEVLAALARARARAGERTAALQTADEAFRAIDAIGDARRVASRRVLEAIAEAQAEAGDVEAAMRTVNAIAASGRVQPEGARASVTAVLKASALDRIALVRAKAGDLPGALRVLDAADAERQVLLVDSDGDGRALRDTHLHDLAEAYSEANDPSAALRWAEGLPTVAGRCQALLGIAEGLTEAEKD